MLLSLCWAAGLLPHPFGDRGAVGTGAVLNAFAPAVGTSFMLALGVIGMVFAAVLARARSRRALRAGAAVGWLTTGVIVLVPLHGTLLTMFGYLPVVLLAGWALPGLPSRYVEVVSEPGSLFLLYCLAGAVLWGMAAQTGTRAQRGACPRCGRRPGWTGADERRCRSEALRTGRIAVAVGVAAALAYPAIRIPWIFGYYPGFSAAEIAQAQGRGHWSSASASAWPAWAARSSCSAWCSAGASGSRSGWSAWPAGRSRSRWRWCPRASSPSRCSRWARASWWAGPTSCWAARR
ncbi:hypothetical protein ACFQXA_16560 [Nocardiopsis composta]